MAAPHPSRAEGGAALIIVLTCLVLVTALALGLLNRVESDRSSSAAYSSGANSRNLAEYAVNVVMAQIATATTGANTGNAWASQPGAIRVYTSNAATLTGIYKLYSSTNMVASNATATNIVTDDATALANWSNSPALYTDLNAPLVSWSGANQVTNYPILDPGATNSVQGFAISGAPNTNTLQPAPMPVTWLYVLQDGTLLAPDSTTTTNATFTASATRPSSANPITGRIAFWTDDETCKVNINTAAGMPWSWATNNPNSSIVSLTAGGTATTLFGSYWDTPVIGSYQDLMLTWAPPWKGEYQRYPGHPATVSLSAVFTNLTTNDIMQIAPRINDESSSGGSGGSQWGTVTTYSGTGPNTSKTIKNDGARLYANVDELLYATNRSATGTNPLTTTQINQGRFFLTASSRAPDVTLFNTPRICIWPLWSTASMRTPLDTKIALASTLNGTPYYFTRANATSPTIDYAANTALLGYLRNMATTAVPGFGGSSGILGKHGTDSEQILTEIFDYIRCINLQDSQTGATRYSPNGLVVPTTGTANTMGFGRMPTVTKAGLIFWYGTSSFNTTNTFYYTTNSGAPGTATTNTTAFTVCARLVLENFIPGQGNPGITNAPAFSNVVTGLTGFQWGTNPASMTKIFANDTTNFDLMNLGTGPSGVVPGGRLNINASSAGSGASNTAFPPFACRYFANSGGTLYFKGNGAPGPTDTKACWPAGPVMASNSAWYTPGGVLISSNGTNAYFTNAWYSNATSITTNYSGFDLTGGNLTISTYYSNTQIQTISGLSFPAVTNLPLPVSNTTTTLNGSAAWSGGSKLRNVTPFGSGNWTIFTNDVVRAVQVTSGDFRMTAAVATVPATSYFTNHPYYTNTTAANQYKANAFAGGPFGSVARSTLASNYYNPNSSVPSSVNGVPFDAQNDMITNSIGLGNLLRYGDFDNGYGAMPDGPYIGFSDEGVYANSGATPPAPGAYPYFDVVTANTFTNLGPGYYSPNRLVPSAGILGSLPTGVKRNFPWQTLLFRPAALTAAGHPGTNNPPDYLLLDLFKMPVVEPYAISEPLSTAGQVNMNYQILPFTWIKRSTAVQAALHTEMITAIPNTMPGGIDITKAVFKKAEGVTTATTRYPLNLDTNTGTLAGFETRFAAGDIFRSAAEICSIPLVPYGVGAASATMATWWNNYSYTGENSKERPYARIYPKLTTKSNVYTVHYTVQTLKKLPSGTQTQWDETKDKVLSTFRGSTTIERYVNPSDTAIPNYTGVSLPLPYKFRILSQRQFSP